MKCNLIIYSFLVTLQLSGACSAASLMGTTIPSASQIIDVNGGVWMVSGGLCYLNGAQAGNCNSVQTLLFYQGSIYVGSTYATWWQWIASGTSGWIQVSGDPRGVAVAIGGATVDALCGTSDSLPQFYSPSGNLCKSGVPSGVSGSGPWGWTCLGQNSGVSVSCSAPLATGRQYYVSTSGNDSNTGTSPSSPWRHIQMAASSVGAGSRVNIAAGTYNEQVNIKTSGTSGGGMISFVGAAAGSTIVDGTGLGSLPGPQATFANGLIQIAASNIVIDGLTLTNSPGSGILIGDWTSGQYSNIVIANSNLKSSFAWSPILSLRNVSSIIIENNNIDRSIPPICSTNNCWAETISMQGSQKATVRWNTILRNQAGEGIDFKDGASNGQIYGNIVSNTTAAMIYLDARGQISNIDIHNNTLGPEQAGQNASGIALANEEYYTNGVGGNGATINGVTIHNNVLFLTNGLMIDALSPNKAYGTITNVNVFNNTIYGGTNQYTWNATIACSHKWGWGSGTYVTNVTVRNNIFYNSVINVCTDLGNPIASFDHNLMYPSQNAYGSNTVLKDPSFVSPPTNFSLNGVSPAINAGSRVGAPTSDILMKEYNHTMDLGAYAYVP